MKLNMYVRYEGAGAVAAVDQADSKRHDMVQADIFFEKEEEGWSVLPGNPDHRGENPWYR
jgi:hypothetical protein